jgi:hypothetical protein
MLPNSDAVLPLFGENLSGEGVALTSCVVASARTVAAHALGLLLQAIITHARGAVTGLYAACALYTVIRRAALETAGLPWCQPTCPVCQWQAILFDLGAPGPPTSI